MSSRWALWLLGVVGACGPSVAVEGPSRETSESGDGVSTSTATSTSTTTTTSTSTSTGDSGTSGESSIFIDEPDTGGSIECHPLDQDCTPGHKCTAWANDGSGFWNGTRCIPVPDDPALPGDACRVEAWIASGLDDCDASSMCWNIDPDTLEGTCVAFCGGTPDAPQCSRADEVCILGNYGVLALCLP